MFYQKQFIIKKKKMHYHAFRQIVFEKSKLSGTQKCVRIH